MKNSDVEGQVVGKSEIEKFPYIATEGTADINFEISGDDIKKGKILMVAFGITFLTIRNVNAIDISKLTISEMNVLLSKRTISEMMVLLCEMECDADLAALQAAHEEVFSKKMLSLQLRISELQASIDASSGRCHPTIPHIICYTISGFCLNKSKEHLVSGNKKFTFCYLVCGVMTSFGCKFL